MENIISQFIATHLVTIISVAGLAIMIVLIINRLQEWIIRSALLVLLVVIGMIIFSYWQDGLLKQKIENLDVSQGIKNYSRQILQKKDQIIPKPEQNINREQLLKKFPGLQKRNNQARENSNSHPAPEKKSSSLLEF